MRFDDMLQTIMDQPINTTAEKIAVWRQLVDCIAQDKGQHDPLLLKNAYQRLMDFTREVPTNIRIDTAETLAGRHIPPLLVQYFACDMALIAMPVISSVRLDVSEWIGILPALRQPVRNILRQREDLDPLVIRALDSLGNDHPVLDLPKEEESENSAVSKQEEKKSSTPDSTISLEKTAPLPNQENNEALPTEDEIRNYRKSLFEKKPEPVSPAKEKPDATEQPSPETAKEDNPPKEEMSFADTIRSNVLHKAYSQTTYFKPFTASLESLTSEKAAPSPEKPEEPSPIQETPSSENPEREDQKAPRFSPFSDRWQSHVIPSEEEHVTDYFPPNEEKVFGFEKKLDHLPPSPPAADTANKDFAWFATGRSRMASKPEQTSASEKKSKTGNESDETQIRHLLARIDAFRRSLEARAEQFNFETDQNGVVIHVKGIASHILAGISLATPALQNGYGVDGQAVGAFGRRAPIRNARLAIPGKGSAAGEWRISASPYFDPETGHFSGYQGIGRRPRIEETAQPFATTLPSQPSVLEIDRDSLRQLMHELRNPLNAIVGFAEMIEHQMLGPVSKSYRYYAADITRQGQRLLQAVDDLNLAATDHSPEKTTLETETETTTNLTKIISALHNHYQETAQKYNGDVLFRVATGLPLLKIDPLAIERIFSRLLATVVGLVTNQEQIEVNLDQQDNFIRFIVKRPVALQGYDEEALLDPGFNLQGEWPNSPVLGLGFTLRLVRNLATAIEGQFEINPDSFVVMLPIKAVLSKAS